MRYSVCLILLSVAFPLQAFSAPSVEQAAKQEFKRCLKETKKARDECTFGGCGNIMWSCYERQIQVIQSDSELQLDKLKAGRCSAEAERLVHNFDTWQTANENLDAFNRTWSGAELSVQSQLLKNHALQMLAYECRN
jgi:hypothetical protein